MDDIEAFQIALMELAKERGTQSIIALDSHLSEGYISQIIGGKRVNPSPRALKKIAGALGKTVREMIDIGIGISEGKAPMKTAPTEPSWMSEALVKSLQSNIDALTDRVNALKNYAESQEQRLIEQKKQIGTITAALIQAEKEKDFLPLKVLTGGG